MRAFHAIAVGALILLSHAAATAAETVPPLPPMDVEHLSSARSDIPIDYFGAKVLECKSRVSGQLVFSFHAFHSPGTLSYHALGTAGQRYAFRSCMAEAGIPLEVKTTISINGFKE